MPIDWGGGDPKSIPPRRDPWEHPTDTPEKWFTWVKSRLEEDEPELVTQTVNTVINPPTPVSSGAFGEGLLLSGTNLEGGEGDTFEFSIDAADDVDIHGFLANPDDALLTVPDGLSGRYIAVIQLVTVAPE